MKLVQAQDYLLFINEKAEIRVNNLFYPMDGKGHITRRSSMYLNVDGCGKIIAYRPLTKEAKELDLPELPPFEVDIEKLACEKYSIKEGLNDYDERYYNSHNVAKAEAFIDGYKAAQAKQFSLDDVKKALSEAFKASQEGYQITADEIIQSLSTQQLPKEFIPSVKEISKYSYRDKSGNEYFTFKGLTRGDIIISNKNQEGIGGDFIPYPMTLIKKDKEYIIKDVSSFGFYTVPWIINEDGDHTIPDFDTFSIKNNEKFKTITNSDGKQELVGIYKY